MNEENLEVPLPGAIRLDLGRRCIQTAIKRLYERNLAASLRSVASAEELGGTLETLRLALETLDFPKLRAAHPALAGGRSDRVELGRDAHNRLKLLIDGSPFDLMSRARGMR